MASVRVSLNFGDLPADLERIAKGLERLPAGGDNPLMAWESGYSTVAALAPRPTVAQSGQYRGNFWEKTQPQYTRKTDGVTVEVWGGQPRAVLGGGFGAEGPHSRLGVVTRAGRDSIRFGYTLTRPERDAGFGVVKKGQRFSRGTVLGKLRKSGARYKQSDKQLNTLLEAWATAQPLLKDSNTRLIKIHPDGYASVIDEKRPFAWGPKIEVEEAERLEMEAFKYLGRLLQ